MTAYAKCPDCGRRAWYDEGEMVWRHTIDDTRVVELRWLDIDPNTGTEHLYLCGAASRGGQKVRSAAALDFAPPSSLRRS